MDQAGVHATSLRLERLTSLGCRCLAGLQELFLWTHGLTDWIPPPTIVFYYEFFILYGVILIKLSFPFLLLSPILLSPTWNFEGGYGGQ